MIILSRPQQGRFDVSRDRTHPRGSRAALAVLVLVAGLATGCALAAAAVEGCRWLFTPEPLVVGLLD